MKINENTQVYCTSCKYFKVLEKVSSEREECDYIPSCEHEKECYLYDCCDSKPHYMRPWYEQR